MQNKIKKNLVELKKYFLEILLSLKAKMNMQRMERENKMTNLVPLGIQ